MIDVGCWDDEIHREGIHELPHGSLGCIRLFGRAIFCNLDTYGAYKRSLEPEPTIEEISKDLRAAYEKSKENPWNGCFSWSPEDE